MLMTTTLMMRACGHQLTQQQHPRPMRPKFDNCELPAIAVPVAVATISLV
jgi:hypothetical protein